MKKYFFKRFVDIRITILRLFVVLLVIAFSNGCQKDSSLSSDKETFDSSEFLEYVKASIVYHNSIIERAMQLNEKYIPIPTDKKVVLNSATYMLRITKNDNLNILNNREEMQYKYRVLLHAYPNFKRYSQETIKSQILKAFYTSEVYKTLVSCKLSQYNLLVKRSEGMKSPDPEYFQNYEDALAAAMAFASENGIEIGGLIFEDGTAMLNYNILATHGDTEIAPFQSFSITVSSNNVSTYNVNGKVIVSTFHTHFYVDYPGNADAGNQAVFYPNCDMIILLNEETYTYQFVNGQIQQ